VARYDVLVDGERKARVSSEDDVREWIASYRQEHAADDPAATHVQVVKVRFAGGELIPLEQFLQ
jgi:hypothetical protein